MKYDVWSMFDMFFSSQKTQQFLANQYKKHELQDSNGKSFDNTYGFIYYIEHGKKYYNLADQAPVELKPVLLFYGMTQLMKACILCNDPDYPDSSSVLAHGLSTRKRKKRSYEFLNDEVKVQKSGLFNHFCEKMFHMKHIEGEKFMMNDLLSTLPELTPLYKQMTGVIYQMKLIKESNDTFLLSKEAADFLHMSADRFEEYMNSMFSSKIKLEVKDENDYRLLVKERLIPFDCAPLHYHLAEDTYYFPVDRDLLQMSVLNELMVHYVLLYNLSMISRYDTEWWSELFHTYTSQELPFINQFLRVTGEKIPYLFGQLLHTMDIP
ncbi:YaaC family protein [Fictibacillus phosphorivorans]|uniref:YaaC family protein n=1 Tax=Fictibacillus phosphorivorans TaxID=1221500 RepID=UPI00203F1A1B|nr:YaaC family protein [Fictibacillus phosphorivorans]MCM3720270.1 YaaC family protein [Fictibacillus phosphorivorans]MCM3777960.1 YaaC family protein [Fictibacillus phosphorivorans]